MYADEIYEIIVDVFSLQLAAETIGKVISDANTVSQIKIIITELKRSINFIIFIFVPDTHISGIGTIYFSVRKAKICADNDPISHWVFENSIQLHTISIRAFFVVMVKLSYC